MFKIKNIFELALIFVIYVITFGFWAFMQVWEGSYVSDYAFLAVYTIGLLLPFLYFVDKQTDRKKWGLAISTRMVLAIAVAVLWLGADVYHYVVDPQIPFQQKITIEKAPNGTMYEAAENPRIPYSVAGIALLSGVAMLDRKRSAKNINKEKLFV